MHTLQNRTEKLTKTGQKSSPKQDRKAHQNRTEKLTKTGQKRSPKQDRKDHQNRTEKLTKTGQKSSPKLVFLIVSKARTNKLCIFRQRMVIHYSRLSSPLVTFIK